MFKEFVDGLIKLFGQDAVDIDDQRVSLYISYDRALDFDMRDVSLLLARCSDANNGVVDRIHQYDEDFYNPSLNLEFILKKNVYYAVWGHDEQRSISDVHVLPDGREKTGHGSGLH
jgi:hypothetical protein